MHQKLSPLTLVMLLLGGLTALSALTGCVRQQGTPQEIEVVRHGALQVDTDEDIPRVVYVNVRDSGKTITQAQRQIENWLTSSGFSLSHNPSQAGYIVQITVLAAGPVNSDALRHAVQAGYDGQAKVQGESGTGLLADVLLVQRRVPEHKRPSRVQLKNISNRNAVGSSQMRIGLLIPHPIDGEGLPPFFADRLAAELGAALREDAATSAGSAAPELKVTPQAEATAGDGKNKTPNQDKKKADGKKG